MLGPCRPPPSRSCPIADLAIASSEAWALANRLASLTWTTAEEALKPAAAVNEVQTLTLDIDASLGLGSIALHVFGHNPGAQALYQSLGYGVTGFNMQKNL